MKKRLSRGEKWLFASPLLLGLAVAGARFWPRSKNIAIVEPNTSNYSAFSFSPDSQKLAAFFYDRVSHKARGAVYDAASGKWQTDLEAPRVGRVYNPKVRGGELFFRVPVWSPDGKRIVCGYYDGIQGTTQISTSPVPPKVPYFNDIPKIAFWNSQNGKLARTVLYASPQEYAEAEVEFSQDGKELIGRGVPTGRFDATTGKRIPSPEGRYPKEEGARIHDELNLISIRNRANRQWDLRDVETGHTVWRSRSGFKLESQWQGDILAVYDTGMPSDHRRDVPGIEIRDARNRRMLRAPVIPQKTSLSDLSLNSDQQTVSAIFLSEKYPNSRTGKGTSCRLGVWDYRQNREVWSYAHPRLASTARWSPDGQWLAVFLANPSGGPTLAVFNSEGKKVLEHLAGAWLYRWSPDSRKIAVLTKNENGESVEILPVGI